MGISGLLPLIKPIMKNKHIKNYKNSRIGIDGYTWIYSSCSKVALDIFLGKEVRFYINDIRRKIEELRKYNIYPIFILDGHSSQMKKVTDDKRKATRAIYKEKCALAIKNDDFQTARSAAMGCLEITAKIISNIVELLKEMNVEYLVAPYEADPQLVYLQKSKYIDLIMTIDSDMIPLGATKVLYNYTGDHVLEYNSENLKKHEDQFLVSNLLDICILSGCDYLTSIKGIGLKTSIKILKNTGTPEKFVEYCKMKKSIPENYLASYTMAKIAFIFPIVYNPVEKKRVFLNSSEVDFQFLGSLEDNGNYYDFKGLEIIRHFIPNTIIVP